MTNLLLVNRCADQTATPVAVGTIECSVCKQSCWIAKSSINQIAKTPEIVVLCTRCVADYQADIVDVRPVPGAVQEIREALAGRRGRR